MKSEIGQDELGWTGFYIDDALVKEAKFVDKRNLDWILKQNPNQSSDRRIEMIKSVQNGDLYLAGRLNN